MVQACDFPFFSTKKAIMKDHQNEVHMLSLSHTAQPRLSYPCFSGQGPDYQDGISESGLVHLTRVTLFSAAWEIGRSCLYLASILGKGICSAEMRSPAHSYPSPMQSDVLRPGDCLPATETAHAVLTHQALS